MWVMFYVNVTSAKDSLAALKTELDLSTLGDSETEIIEIRTLAGHAMETGFRRTQLGEVIPRDIIRTLVCTYNGVEVFRADLHPAIAANP